MRFNNKNESEYSNGWLLLTILTLTILSHRYFYSLNYFEKGFDWFFGLAEDVILGSVLGIFVYGISLELLKLKGIGVFIFIWALILVIKIFS
jgi:hypothetical protein